MKDHGIEHPRDFGLVTYSDLLVGDVVMKDTHVDGRASTMRILQETGH